MREGWEVKTLDDLCSFSNGLWKGKKPPYINVGVIRNTNFTKEGFLDDSNIAYLDVEEKQFAKRSLKFGDIILEKSGGGPKQAVGRVVLFNKRSGDFSFSNFTAAIRVEDVSILDARFLHKYLYWAYLSGVTEKMQSHSTGIRNLKLKEYKSLEIPLPPLAEQKRIVALLDQAFAGIELALAAASKNLKNAVELFETTLNTTFTQKGEGWAETTLGEVCSITSKLVDPKEEEYLDLPHLGAGNMISDTGGIIDVKTAREEGLISGKFVFEPDTVLYSKIRPYLKKACRPDFMGLCSADVYPLSVRPDVISKDYLYHLLMSADFTDYAISGSSRAGMPKVNRNHLFAYRFWIPEVSKQQDSVSRLDGLKTQTQHLEALYQQKIDALNELKQSLLQKAFAGELTANQKDAA